MDEDLKRQSDEVIGEMGEAKDTEVLGCSSTSTTLRKRRCRG